MTAAATIAATTGSGSNRNIISHLAGLLGTFMTNFIKQVLASRKSPHHPTQTEKYTNIGDLLLGSQHVC